MSSLKSRILQFLPEKLLNDLNKICCDVTISDNNIKVDLMVAVLDKYDIDYSELGPGTNRFAILIDGYVFKLAMDRLGVIDNWAEFSLTQELQPFVIKVYECNGLVIVTEYVTVISKDEFMKNKDVIRKILSSIADRYLLGDVGTVSKNFMNWGYRDNSELTILDFAYIYRIQGEEMICGGKNKVGDECQSFLMYDENFYNLLCPVCGKKYIFTDIRTKIDPDYEKREVAMIKQISELVIEPMTEKVSPTNSVTSTDVTVNQLYNISEGDEENMSYKDNRISDEELEDSYAKALEFLKHGNQIEAEADTLEEIIPSPIISDMHKVEETAEKIVDELNTIDQNSDELINIDICETIPDSLNQVNDVIDIQEFIKKDNTDIEVSDEDIDFYMSRDYNLTIRQNDETHCIDVNYPQFPMLGIVHNVTEDGAIEEIENRLRLFIRDCLKTRNTVPLPNTNTDTRVSYNDVFNLGSAEEPDVNVDDQMVIKQQEGGEVNEHTEENSNNSEVFVEYNEDISSITGIPIVTEENIVNETIYVEQEEIDDSEPLPVEKKSDDIIEATITIAKTTEIIESTIVIETLPVTPSVSVETVDKKVNSFIRVIPAQDNSDSLRNELRNSLILDGDEDHFSEEEQDEFDKIYDENIQIQQRSKYSNKKKPLSE